MSKQDEKIQLRNNPTLRRLGEVLRPYSSQLIIAMVGMVAVGGFNAVQAYMVQPLLDEIFYKKDARLLNLLPLALLAVFFVKGIFYFAYSYLLEKVGQSIIRDLRNRERRGGDLCRVRVHGGGRRRGDAGERGRR